VSDEPSTASTPSTPLAASSPGGVRLPRIAPGQPFLGAFDAIDHGYEASGWVFDISQPQRICTVELRIDGQPVTQVTADRPRPDLRAGRIRAECGFRITLPAALFDGTIRMAEVLLMPETLRIGQPRPVAAVILDHRTDPKTFSVDSILKLRDGPLDYEAIISQAFLARHGVHAAVAYVFLWLLKRPPDQAGWSHYSEQILSGTLGLGAVLRELAASEEAQRAQRSGINLAFEFEAVLEAAARLPPATSSRLR
jgi:hypothetical protein